MLRSGEFLKMSFGFSMDLHSLTYGSLVSEQSENFVLKYHFQKLITLKTQSVPYNKPQIEQISKYQ